MILHITLESVQNMRVSLTHVLLVFLILGAVSMGRKPHPLGTRRRCTCLVCSGEILVHRNTVARHVSTYGSMPVDDIQDLVTEQRNSAGDELESDESDEDADAVVLRNLDIYSEIFQVHAGDPDDQDNADAGNDRGSSEDDEDNPDWWHTEEEEAVTLEGTIKRWLAGKS